MTAPIQSAQGDINSFVLTEISTIKNDVGSMKSDINEIKGYIQDQTQSKQAKHSYIREITLLGIAAVIAAAISFLTGYKA